MSGGFACGTGEGAGIHARCSDAFLPIAWAIAAYLLLAVLLRPSTVSLRNQEKTE